MNWDIKEIHNYNEYMQKYSIHSLLAKIFAQREYNEQDVQGHTSKRLIYHDFSLFLDADLVLDRIQEALENDEKICIYGDYDCDGILSTAILVQAFLELGKKVGYHIPNRFEDGYGLNKESAKKEINRIDKLRANHYKYYTEKDFKEPSNYDICINSDAIGIDNAVNLICDMVKNLIK